MQIDVNTRRRRVERRVIVGDIEAKAVLIGDAAVAEALQKIVDPRESLATDQQVEIAVWTKRGVNVERLGQDGALEGDHGNVRALEGLASTVRWQSGIDAGSLWAGLFDLRENLLGRALEDLRAIAF